MCCNVQEGEDKIVSPAMHWCPEPTEGLWLNLYSQGILYINAVIFVR